MNKAVLALCLLMAAAMPASAELYRGHDTPYSMVMSQDITIDYPGRKQGLDVRVTYPQQGKNLPVFIFSHAAFRDGQAYEPLAAFIAGHGYVVLQPTHADEMKFGYARAVDNPLSFGNWDERPQEISHLINKLDTVTEKAPVPGAMMDQEKIGVGGHSFGAHTTQLLAGMTIKRPFNYTNDKRTSFRDDRIMAFVSISPQGTGSRVDEKSYETIYGPVLFVAGGNDVPANENKSFTWRLEPYRFAAPEDKYLLFIDGAYHGFGGISSGLRDSDGGPTNADQQDAVRSGTLAFLDAYVKGDQSAKDWLNAGNLRKETTGLAQITKR